MRVVLVDSLEEAAADVAGRRRRRPTIVATSAKMRPNAISFADLRRKIWREDGDCLLVFGTGHGIAEEVLESSDHVLKPVEGRGVYNHLSVRSAVAIIVDRLLGE